VTVKAYHSINAALMAYLVDPNQGSLLPHSDLELAANLISAMHTPQPNEQQ
jgi:hypothetical protein